MGGGKRLTLVALAASFLGTADAGAQIVFTPESFFPTGVNNEGIVVGSRQAFTPLELWNPDDDSFQVIGGMSAGNSAGGSARFLSDGTIVGSAYNEHYLLPSSWQRTDLDMTGWTVYSMAKKPMTKSAYTAVGHNADKTEGMMFQSMNGGQTWSKWIVTSEKMKGLNAMKWLSWDDALAVGSSAYHVKSNGTFTEVDLHPEGNEYAVEEYLSVDFLDCAEGEYMATYGVVGVKYATETRDDEVNAQISPREFAVWYTTDTGDTWNEARGVSGYPVYLTHYGEVYYMLTNYVTETKNLSALWSSDDYGLTWKFISIVKKTPHTIHFMDATNAVVAAEGAVLFTADGGKTWTERVPVADMDWNEVIKIGDSVIAAGGGTNVYETTDNGETWTKLDLKADTDIDFTALMEHEGALSVAGRGASFFFNGGESEKAAYGAHIYNIEDNTWTPMAHNGYFSGDNANNPYGVSGDGSTVVGNIYTAIGQSSLINAHAVAWVNGEPIDLGSLFDFQKKHTTAYAASYDGSVIVGCQDVFGPWFAAVWRRQSDGSYKEELMLKDPDKTLDDIDWHYDDDGNGNKIINFLGNEANAAEFLGSCRAVSKKRQMDRGHRLQQYCRSQSLDMERGDRTRPYRRGQQHGRQHQHSER